jgi:hypothetical protein
VDPSWNGARLSPPCGTGGYLSRCIDRRPGPASRSHRSGQGGSDDLQSLQRHRGPSQVRARNGGAPGRRTAGAPSDDPRPGDDGRNLTPGSEQADDRTAARYPGVGQPSTRSTAGRSDLLAAGVHDGRQSFARLEASCPRAPPSTQRPRSPVQELPASRLGTDETGRRSLPGPFDGMPAAPAVRGRADGDAAPAPPPAHPCAGFRPACRVRHPHAVEGGRRRRCNPPCRRIGQCR